MLVIPPNTIARLATRIEQAYVRRHPRWEPDWSHEEVWSAAAAMLVGLHLNDPSLPLDPELFVACQESMRRLADPWRELVLPSAARRYRLQVRRMVRFLRREIEEEVRRGERRLRQGASLEEVIAGGDPRLSPLGRLVLAWRSNRADLASWVWHGAVAQHQACPLYRQALAGLVHADDYPQPEAVCLPVGAGAVGGDEVEDGPSAEAPARRYSLN